MGGWHHCLDGHEFEQAPGVGDGQGSLVCSRPWDRRVRHVWVTELTELILIKRLLWWFTWLKIHLQSRKTWIQSLGWEDPLEQEKAMHKKWYSFLENSMNSGALQAVVHGMAESDTTE